MFDTLQFADRLKSSGFESRQAEGMARALGHEMGRLLERLVTKADLDAEVGAIRSDITAVDGKVDALSRCLSAKVDALNAQIKFILAALGILMALGLIDTVPGILG